MPLHYLANSLYLEWFSETNGRVVVESADYDIAISSPEWRLTPEEDEQRARDAAAAMAGFMRRLTEAIEAEQRGQKDPEAAWDEHDYERLLRESDARTDKFMELLDRSGGSDLAEDKIAQEMGWARGGSGDAAERTAWEEMDDVDVGEADADDHEPGPEPDPQREGIDWIRTAEGEFRHPLQNRCSEAALRFWREVEELGLGEMEDPNLCQDKSFRQEVREAAHG